jgi:hypothetical protein
MVNSYNKLIGLYSFRLWMAVTIINVHTIAGSSTLEIAERLQDAI